MSSNHILSLVKNCPPPVIITQNQKKNPSLFSGSLNNTGTLTTNFSIYSKLAEKKNRPSNWVTKTYTVNKRVIERLSNN